MSTETENRCPVEHLPRLYDEDYRHSAHPAIYDRLAEQGPIQRVMVPGEVPVWMITRHAEAREAMRDPRLIKNPSGFTSRQQPIGRRRVPEDITVVAGRQPSNTDGPEHARLRHVLNPLLSHAALERHQPEITRIVEEHAGLLRARTRGGAGAQAEADLVSGYARPVVVAVTSHVLGLKPEHAERMMILGIRQFGPEHPEDPEMVAGYRELTALVAESVEERERRPGRDVTSLLVRAHRAGSLSRRELLSMVATLVLGSGGPPTTLISYGAALLLHDERARAALLDGRAPQVVEELLRIHPPVPSSTWRFAAEPLEIGGQRIETGEAVLIALPAANRDARVYANAATIDVGDRPPAPHVSFGNGPHYCAGAFLARRTAATALPALFRAFPEMALAEGLDQAEWNGVLGNRLPDAIRVRLGREQGARR